jgi:hypothetical protein
MIASPERKRAAEEMNLIFAVRSHMDMTRELRMPDGRHMAPVMQVACRELNWCLAGMFHRNRQLCNWRRRSRFALDFARPREEDLYRKTGAGAFSIVDIHYAVIARFDRAIQ